MGTLKYLPIVLLALVAAPAIGQPATKPTKKTDRVVFLIDGTGSMLGKQASVADEITKAMSQMKPTQAVGVVIAVEPKPLILDPQAATPANAKKVDSFIRTHRPGGADKGILAAMATVAKMRPDVVWFISDGDMQDYSVTPAAIGKAAKGYRINTTTAFARTEDPVSDEVEGLRRIATLADGVCVNRKGERLEPTNDKRQDKPARPATGPSIFVE